MTDDLVRRSVLGRAEAFALLQASPDGAPLYAHLGFTTLGTLRGFVHP